MTPGCEEHKSGPDRQLKEQRNGTHLYSGLKGHFLFLEMKERLKQTTKITLDFTEDGNESQIHSLNFTLYEIPLHQQQRLKRSKIPDFYIYNIKYICTHLAHDNPHIPVS